MPQREDQSIVRPLLLGAPISRRRVVSLLGMLGGGALAATFLPGRIVMASVTDHSKVLRTEEEWRKALSPEAYYVLREEGTEPPFSSPLNKEHRHGHFVCAGCGAPLFYSEAKYESGTGWPSFWQARKGSIETKTDYKLVSPRTEYHCARCGGHQGHVFDDGPRPTGLRYCNNGVALRFIEEGDES